MSNLKASTSLEHSACLEALDLLAKKAEDYNTGVERQDYFPFGLTSYSHMIHTKSLRLVSLCKSDKNPNFESARDTLLDLINYAAMTLVELDKERINSEADAYQEALEDIASYLDEKEVNSDL